MRTTDTSFRAHNQLLRRLYTSRKMVFYASLFLAGVFLGAVFLRSLSPEELKNLSALVGQFAKHRGEQTLISTFISSFTTTAIMLGVLLVCGFCAVAQPVIILLPFFRGLGFGYQAGYIYAQNGFTGMGYVALVLLPNMLLSTLIILYACGEAFKMSNAYYRAANHGEGGGLINLRGYLARFFILLLLAFFVSVLDAVFTGLFGRLFTLV